MKTLGRSNKTKTPMLGILEKGGKVIARPVENVRNFSLMPIMATNVARGKEIHTDELHFCRTLSLLKYDHEFARHSEGEYVTN